MGANSLPRRLVKFALRPLLTDTTYQYVQMAAKAWDIRSEAWTEPELDLVPLCVRPGEAAIDIGANFGMYSYHLSRAVGPTGRVFAFEPIPFTHQTLRKVVRLLGLQNVTVVPKGCSDKDGQISFEVPLAESGALSTGVAYARGRNDDRAGKEMQVRWEKTHTVTGEVVALDDYLPDLPVVSLLKCDIEGAEPLAFLGARKLLERHHPIIICEINPWYLEGFGFGLDKDLLEPLFRLGYRLYFYDHARRVLIPKTPEQVVEDNYVFVHPSRRDRLSTLLRDS
jgi:FkbM family methyltransferase